MTILIVDDNQDIREILKENLKDAGYDVIEAVDGKDGLWKLAQHGQIINCIITDLQMPKLNGYEFASEARKTIHEHVPIILYSACPNAKKTIDINKVVDKFQFDEILEFIKNGNWSIDVHV